MVDHGGQIAVAHGHAAHAATQEHLDELAAIVNVGPHLADLGKVDVKLTFGPLQVGPQRRRRLLLDLRLARVRAEPEILPTKSVALSIAGEERLSEDQGAPATGAHVVEAMVGRHTKGGQLLLKSRAVRQPQVAQGQVRASGKRDQDHGRPFPVMQKLGGFTAAFADAAASSRAAKPETNAVLSIILFFLHLWGRTEQGYPLVARAAPGAQIDS